MNAINLLCRVTCCPVCEKSRTGTIQFGIKGTSSAGTKWAQFTIMAPNLPREGGERGAGRGRRGEGAQEAEGSSCRTHNRAWLPRRTTFSGTRSKQSACTCQSSRVQNAVEGGEQWRPGVGPLLGNLQRSAVRKPYLYYTYCQATDILGIVN